MDRMAGVSPEALKAFLATCSSLIGAEWVLSSPVDLAPYGWVAIPFETEEHMPAGVVCPSSLDELRKVVAVAQDRGVPLWPTSTGRNIGYGSSSVADKGTVVLDLRRMDRITDYDPELGTVVVEPGVTYAQLQEFLKSKGGKYWLDFPGPGPIVSPMGNTLERGHGVTPYGDHFAHSCGYEVLLADGTLFRTGLGGVRDTNSWQTYRYGFGPTLDGIFTQSNFGIIAKMGLWLMPAPASFRTVLAVWPEDEDIVRLTDAVRDLRMDGTIATEGVMGNATIFLAATRNRASLYTGEGAIPQELAIREAKAAGLGAWNFVFTLYGRPDRVASDYAEAKRRLEASGARIMDARDEQAINELTLKSFALFNWTGGGGLAWCSPVAPLRGKEMQRQFQLVRGVMDRHGVDFLVGVAFAERAALNVMPLLYDRGDKAWMKRVHDCYAELVDAIAEGGYGIYRTSIGYMDQVARNHGVANLDVNRRIKRALDPKGIIAPGKSGIRI